MGVARFTLDLTADRPPELTIAGREGTLPIVGITVRHVPPSLPQLILELVGEVEVTGEGIVMLDHGGDTAADLRQILGNLDPDTLDEAATRKFGMDDRQGRAINSPGQAFVEAILDALEGVRA
ncbi:MAG: hypothetical protein LC798_16770 [Chloroflexi bacterium]|nr:hypothetical protein [Chloroflexota bacterium]